MRSTAAWLVPIALASSIAVGARAQPEAGATRELRVCSDPNNLPFSNRLGEGFENRIAELVARDMGAKLQYYWIPQRRGWVRRATREEQLCDLAIGVPSKYELLLTTQPYYRSSYVFVQRKDRPWHVASLDDPRLRGLKIGVHLVGDDYQNTPPAQALARRGVIKNIVGYSVLGDYSEQNPPARLIEAVARGDVDLGIAWGPTAGYFTRKKGVKLEITPVTPQFDPPSLPFVFDISMGVRRTEGTSGRPDPRAAALKAELETILRRRHGQIARILADYGVPVLNMTAEQ